MKIQILITTMHKSRSDIEDLLKKWNVQSDIIIGNQCDVDEDYSFTYNDVHQIRVHSSKERGVSRNRNVLSTVSDADVILYLDDDCRLVDNYISIIEEAFRKYPHAACIMFYGSIIGKEHNPPTLGEGKAKFYDVSHLGVPGLAIKKAAVEKYHLFFNEKLGSPNYLYNGEDSVYLYELFRKKVPLYLCNELLWILLEDKTVASTYFKGYDEHYFNAKGAVTKILHPYIGFLNHWRNAFRWKKKTNLSILQIHKYLKKGSKMVKRKDYLDPKTNY